METNQLMDLKQRGATTISVFTAQVDLAGLPVLNPSRQIKNLEFLLKLIGNDFVYVYVWMIFAAIYLELY